MGSVAESGRLNPSYSRSRTAFMEAIMIPAMRRLILRGLAGLIALLLIILIGTFVSLRRSLPDIDGSVTVTGTSAPIDIIRDADAIPHIFAATRLDALFGLGYAHAQDRLWEMEFQRRIGYGRLSEIFGEVTVPQDRFLRTVAFGRAARSAWDSTPEWAKQQINAYVAGINAFIASHHGTSLALELSLLRFEPEPFTGPDVLVWVKMMAWDLSANYAFELLRHDLVRAVGADRAAQLMPAYPADGLSILPNGHSTDEAAPELRTQNLELGTRHLELGTRHLELGTRHLELRTRNVELKAPDRTPVLSAAFSVLSSHFSVLSSSRSEGL